MELGSGYGYSGYWHARATGPEGEVHPDRREIRATRNEEGLPGAAGLAERTEYHVGDAVTEMGKLDGDFDVVFDIDKDGYPDAPGAPRASASASAGSTSATTCSGTAGSPSKTPTTRARTTEAVLEHNRLVAEDERYVSTIVPTRDGVLVATRVE